MGSFQIAKSTASIDPVTGDLSVFISLNFGGGLQIAS